MKRLVALLLVFGMASAANAVYLQIDGVATDNVELVEGTTSVITVVGEDSSSWFGYLIIENGGAGTLGEATILDAAGDLASYASYEDDEWTGYELTTGSSPGSSMPISAGSQFNVTFSGGTNGETAKISLYLDPEYTTPVSSVDVSIVPEPITIALLGFGALFIRRR